MTLEEIAKKRAAEAAQEAQQPIAAADVPQEAAAQEVQENAEPAAAVTDERKTEIVYTATGKEFKLPEQLEEYRKDNPVGAKVWEEQQKKAQQEEEKNNISRILRLICFTIDYAKDPEDALLEYNVPGAMYSEISKGQFERLVSKAAEATGGDPEQIADKERRTPEQQQALIEAAAKEQIARLDALMNSNYMQAIKALDSVTGKYIDPEPKNDYTVKQMAALCFFAIGWLKDAPEKVISPTAKNSLTEENITEIKAIFSRLDAYYMRKTNGGQLERTPNMFIEFIRHEMQKDGLSKIAIKRAKKIEYPLDNVNSQIWDLLENDTGKQLALSMAKNGSKKEINLIYSIDFDDLSEEIKITKRLLPFDKRVYIAISALFNAGNTVITLTQIYYAMGYTGRPGNADLEKINNAITKMTAARIYVNNAEEAAAYKYKKFIYDGSLLPLERGTAVINGQLADAAIHIFREPPVITFAKQRQQITTLEIKLLQSPVSKTDANLQIEDYLIERIARAKAGKGQPKILYKTFYEHIGLDNETPQNKKNIKKRLPGKIEKYLTYYKKCNYILSYSMEADGFTVSF